MVDEDEAEDEDEVLSRQDKTRQEETRQEETRQEKRREYMTRQGEEGQAVLGGWHPALYGLIPFNVTTPSIQ